MLPEGIVSIRIPGGKDRKRIIGGSDYQHIVSLSNPDVYKYGCIRQLCYAKRGTKVDFPERQRKITARGKLMEPIIRKIFQKDMECKFSKKRPRATEMWPGQPIPNWMITEDGKMGHVDDLYYIPPETDDVKFLKVAEYKSMNSHVWFPYLENGLSPGYKLQPQHYMISHGLEMSTLGVCWPDGIDYMPEPISRDEETVRLMYEAGEWFMKDIVGATKLPDRLPLTEQRCGECKYRLTCLGRGYYEEHVLAEFAFDDDAKLYKLMKDHRDAQDDETASKNIKKVIAQEIKEYLAKHYPEGNPRHDAEKIHCREIDGAYAKTLRSSFLKTEAQSDSKEAADLIRKYTKVSPMRSFSTRITKKSQERWEFKSEA